MNTKENKEKIDFEKNDCYGIPYVYFGIRAEDLDELKQLVACIECMAKKDVNEMVMCRLPLSENSKFAKAGQLSRSTFKRAQVFI